MKKTQNIVRLSTKLVNIIRLFCYNQDIFMKKKKSKSKTIFDSIRKPIAPSTQKIGKNKPDEKVNPSRRKTKHKKSENLNEQQND